MLKKLWGGEKRATWRLFDDKDLTLGDELQLINKETSHIFGTATITALYVKTLGTLEEKDWEGHERFISGDVMYATYRQYYGALVAADTTVKIITFSFIPKVYNKIVVVDENDMVVGSEYMRDAIKRGMIRRAARVYVFNESRQLLVQQRSAYVLKPLLLDQSAAGHVDEGETYEQTAYRELKEELGIEGIPLELVATSFRTKDFYNAIYKVVVPDDSIINFDPEELAAVIWYDINTLDTEMTAAPEKFTPAFLEAWVLLRDKLLAV